MIAIRLSTIQRVAIRSALDNLGEAAGNGQRLVGPVDGLHKRNVGRALRISDWDLQLPLSTIFLQEAPGKPKTDTPDQLRDAITEGRTAVLACEIDVDQLKWLEATMLEAPAVGAISDHHWDAIDVIELALAEAVVEHGANGASGRPTVAARN